MFGIFTYMNGWYVSMFLANVQANVQLIWTNDKNSDTWTKVILARIPLINHHFGEFPTGGLVALEFPWN